MIRMNLNWQFDLDPHQTRLVLKALGGRLRDDAEIAEAKALGDALTRERASLAQHLATEMQKHASKLGD